MQYLIVSHLLSAGLHPLPPTQSRHTSFKILTGYGSTGATSKSKQAAITSLSKMKKDGIIKAFLPGEVLTKLLTDKDYFYIDKVKYQNVIKDDKDIGNDGIIFVFV